MRVFQNDSEAVRDFNTEKPFKKYDENGRRLYIFFEILRFYLRFSGKNAVF
jgi:hypothetical protein